MYKKISNITFFLIKNGFEINAINQFRIPIIRNIRYLYVLGVCFFKVNKILHSLLNQKNICSFNHFQH